MQIARAHVEKRLWPFGFRWRVRKRLFNRHDNAIRMRRGLHIILSARYGLLGSDAAHSGTDLPTFRWDLIASSNLVEIYRPIEKRSVSRFKYHEFVGVTIQSAGGNLGYQLQNRT